MTLGCTFVARSFSGDKAQLVPILKAGLKHKGFAFVDVISPCVTFNDHEGSTKSYAYTREHDIEVVQADFIGPHEEITVDYAEGDVKNVMLHEGGWVRLHKVAGDYDPTDRDNAYAYIRERQRAGEVVTGLLYISSESRDMHEQSGTIDRALVDVPYEKLMPGAAELARLQEDFC
jgi:2-oxoglutarate/2-oxoacid ferredoxin oxidoreductase subunit beta